MGSKFILAVGGQAGMGKDTFVDEAERLMKMNASAYRTSFAEGVKSILSNTFSVSLGQIERSKRDPEPMPEFQVSTRRALQMIGDGFREIKQDVWVEQLLKRVDASDATHALVTDLRYENEMKALKKRGGILVLVGRACMLNEDANPSESFMRLQVERQLGKHAGEKVVDLRHDETTEFDFFVRNDGSLAEYRESVRRVLDLLGMVLKT